MLFLELLILCSLSVFEDNFLPEAKILMLILTVVDLIILFFFFYIIGINDQGLYRVVGVSSKVQRLLSLLMGMPLFYKYFFNILFNVVLLSIFNFKSTFQ